MILTPEVMRFNQDVELVLHRGGTSVDVTDVTPTNTNDALRKPYPGVQFADNTGLDLTGAVTLGSKSLSSSAGNAIETAFIIGNSIVAKGEDYHYIINNTSGSTVNIELVTSFEVLE